MTVSDTRPSVHDCPPGNCTALVVTGAQAVDWLMKWSFIQRRAEGSVLVSMLLELGHLQLAGSLAAGTDSGRSRDSKVFQDDANTLYKFVSLGRCTTRAFPLNSVTVGSANLLLLSADFSQSALRFGSGEHLDLECSDDSSDSGDEASKEQVSNAETIRTRSCTRVDTRARTLTTRV